MYKTVSCLKGVGGALVPATHRVIEETPFRIVVNDRLLATVMASPVDLEEFITGYLFTSRTIREIGEITSIEIDATSISVTVTKHGPLSGPATESKAGSRAPLLKSRVPLDSTFSYSRIIEGSSRVLETDHRRSAGGIHAAGLVCGDDTVLIAEDIGRHNALDRVIGKALRTHTDFSSAFVVLSGRISSEMIQKCITAGIPVIASRGAATSHAIESGAAAGISVIGFVRAGDMVIYSCPERVHI